MTWFKVDDTLSAHPKARRAGLAAMGLWVVAGSWCSQQLTDGFVPGWYADTWPDGRKLAEALVAARMWSEVEVDGEEGWLFHEWTQANPTAEQVKAERTAAKERQRKARDRRLQERRDAEPTFSVSHAVTNTVTHDEVTPPVTAESHRESHLPRPDPTRPESSKEDSPDSLRSSGPPKSKRKTRLPNDLDLSGGRAQRAHDLGMDRETAHHEFEKFRTYHAAKGTLFLDWDAAWRSWTLKWQESGSQHRAGNGRQGARTGAAAYLDDIQHGRYDNGFHVIAQEAG
jgi:hypothetical protein